MLTTRNAPDGQAGTAEVRLPEHLRPVVARWALVARADGLRVLAASENVSAATQTAAAEIAAADAVLRLLGVDVPQVVAAGGGPIRVHGFHADGLEGG